MSVVFCGALAQDQPVRLNNGSENASIVVDFPVVDYRYNWADGFTFPSMQQSLHLTKDVYQYTHYKIAQALPTRPVWSKLSIVGFDILMSWVPFGDAWLHEEWHRAVMSNRKIDSYNEVYDIPLFADTISVSHVKDEDLIRLKKEYPADLVRLHAAGIESQYELNFAIEKDLFYYKTQSWDDVILWLNYANNIAYLYTCASNDSNTITNEILSKENTDISQRDFTGLDCDAWVYDLFRPQEEYAARGKHPSGIGVNRYIKYADLADEEQDYLSKQFYLSFLNLLDPFIYRLHRFEISNPYNHRKMATNVTLRHHLTAFGYTIDANFFFQQAQTNLLLTTHHYFNRQRFFPGLDVAIFRYPVNILSAAMNISTRASLWMQPKDQAYKTSDWDFGGLLSVRLAYPMIKGWDAYVEVEGKTDGWVAGNVYLENNVSLRLGLKGFIQ